MEKEFWEDGTMWIINLKIHHIQQENRRRKNEKMITILLFANLREEVELDRFVISEKKK